MNWVLGELVSKFTCHAVIRVGVGFNSRIFQLANIYVPSPIESTHPEETY